MASVLEASGFQRNFFQKAQKGNGNITMSALNRICRRGLNMTIPQFYEPNREETTLTADQFYCIERIPKLSGDNYRRLLDYARGLGHMSAVGGDAIEAQVQIEERAPFDTEFQLDEKKPL